MAASNTAVPASRISLGTALFNPFYYVAGAAALGLGLLVLLFTGLIGSVTSVHVDGVLDFHVGRPAPFWVYLAEGPIDWLALAVPLYIFGRVLSRSRGVRAIDVFGTQALARTPYLVAALVTLLPPVQATIAKLQEAVRPGQRLELAAVLDGGQLAVHTAMAAFSVLMFAWMVALMYRAYASSCNLNGARAIASFVVALIVGEIISKVAIGFMIGRVI